MKNNLLKKLLAVFLTGTMLFGVGCKDYDDDIDTINKRLDGMDVTVAGLEDQITSIEASVTKLEGLNATVNELSGKLGGIQTEITSIKGDITAIGNVQQKLTDLETSLKAYADKAAADSETSLRSELATKAEVATLRTTISNLETSLKAEIKKVADALALLDGRVGNLETADFATAIDGLKERIGALETAPKPDPDYAKTIKELKDRLEVLESVTDIVIKDNILATLQEKSAELLNEESWLGKGMTAAVKAYLTDTENGYATVTDTQDAVIEKLKTDITNAKEEYTIALVELIKANSIQQSDLSSAITTFENKITPMIEALQARVDALESRIQSLVFVPSTIGEATTNTIVFEAASWIEGADQVKYYLGGAGEQTAQITYRVAPASKAKEIADAWTAYAAAADQSQLTAPVSFVEEKVTRAASENVFTVENVTAGEDGKFTVSVSTTYKFGSETNAAKAEVTPAIALHIRLAGAEADGKTRQGVDYVSAFIVTAYADGQPGGAVNANLVLAKGTDDASPKAFGPQAIELASELEYSNTAAVEFLAGYGVYYKDSKNKLHALDSKWSGLSAEIVAPKIEDGAEEYTTDLSTEDKAKVTLSKSSVKINTPAVTMIGKYVKSMEYGINAIISVDGTDAKVALGKAAHKVSITGSTTNASTAKAEIAWNVTGSAAQKFVKEVAVTAGQIDATTYTSIQSCIFEATTLGAGKYTVAVEKRATDGIYAATDEIKVDGSTFVLKDGQKVEVTLTDKDGNAPTATADYRITAKYQLDNGIFVNITTEVVFSGAPTFASLPVSSAITFTNGADNFVYAKVAENLGAALWTANETALKAVGYADKATFVTAVAGGTFAAGEAAEDGSNLEKNAGVSGEMTLDLKLGTDLTKMAASYALTGTIKAGQLSFPVGAAITVNAPAATLNASGAMGSNNTISYAAAIGSTSYPESAIDLTGAYYLSGADKEKVAIAYAIGEDLTDFQGTKPAISGNDLTWNKWNGLDMKIKAQMALADNAKITFGTALEYTANIADPIQESTFGLKADANTTLYYNDDSQKLDLASIVTLKTIADGEVFDDAQSDDLATAVKEAIGGEAKFTVSGYNVDEGVITVTGSQIVVAKTTTIYSSTTELTVTVAYKNQFKAYKNYTFKVQVKPVAEKPAAEVN